MNTIPFQSAALRKITNYAAADAERSMTVTQMPHGTFSR